METHKHMTNVDIAKLLRQVAAAYEVKNEDLFRIRAYQNAADSIEHATAEVKDLWQENRLRSIPGIGASLASHLDELFRTGKVKHFDQVTKNLPQGMFELLDIPSIGPRTALKLAKHLGLTKTHSAITKLRQAAEAGKIAEIEGFAAESQREILAGISETQRRSQRIMLIVATQIADRFVDYMRKCPAVLRIDPLGSLRRRTTTVGDIDLAVATKDAKSVLDHFVNHTDVKEILAQGGNTARVILKNNLQVDIKTQTPDKYGALLQHFTGSKSHNIHLREIALTKKLSLSEYGIKRQIARLPRSEAIRGGKWRIDVFSDEEKFYQALGLEWIPPELREDSGEIEASLAHKLPKLVEVKDIKGDLHNHTNYDWISSHDVGADTPQAMVKKALELDYEYIGLSDHNPSLASYSTEKISGLIKKRKQFIDQLNHSSENKSHTRSVKILNTLEVDIRTNGNLALSDADLEFLDFAIVSVHSSMRMSKLDMTKRMLEGLSHPKAKILGHPTGRLLNRREGYDLDWDQVFDFCRKHQKIIEINSQPQRLDLPDMLVREAIKEGIMISIGTDAHAADQLTQMQFGLDVARRGWAEAKHIVNTLPWSQFRAMMGIA